jgi:hypothetical protein
MVRTTSSCSGLLPPFFSGRHLNLRARRILPLLLLAFNPGPRDSALISRSLSDLLPVRSQSKKVAIFLPLPFPSPAKSPVLDFDYLLLVDSVDSLMS